MGQGNSGKAKDKEIEREIKHEFTESTRDPNDILKLIINVLQSASDELQLLFSSFSTFQKMQNIGVREIINERASINGTDTKILVYVEKEAESKAIKKETRSKRNNGVTKENHMIEIRPILNLHSHKKVTAFISDSSSILSLEMKENNKVNQGIKKSAVLATYSNNQSMVDTYATIFETLWAKAGSQNNC